MIVLGVMVAVIILVGVKEMVDVDLGVVIVPWEDTELPLFTTVPEVPSAPW